eukprot:TRINITY_DN7990_c0_g1_i1.p1 TRINITY_DN7990_c0_g1~~TRINITY_DN7990_c0_g1_i1.p1  ORF type:complete len:147 (+),score=37.36 TRINITY_DN7990_c0_g1_i1:24-464(+)
MCIRDRRRVRDDDCTPEIDYTAALQSLTADIFSKFNKILNQLHQSETIEESLYLSKLVLFLRKKIKEKSRTTTQLSMSTTRSMIPGEQHLRLVVGVEHSIEEVGKLLDEDNRKANSGLLSHERMLALLLFYLNIQKTLSQTISQFQ